MNVRTSSILNMGYKLGTANLASERNVEGIYDRLNIGGTRNKFVPEANSVHFNSVKYARAKNQTELTLTHKQEQRKIRCMVWTVTIHVGSERICRLGYNTV
jgi:hypothetical protein